MASSRPGKRIISAGTNYDIISCLPGEIKEKILTKLSIRDAVRTSILSTKWRYTWASMPELLVKDDDLIPIIETSGASSYFVRIVDLLLFIHKGPILKFFLSTKHHRPEAFDRWFLSLSRNRIAEINFLLKLASNTHYRIPSNFFFCNALQHVQLSRCSVKLPCCFEGFKLLRILKLECCIINGADIEWIVFTSPQLEMLILIKPEPFFIFTYYFSYNLHVCLDVFPEYSHASLSSYNKVCCQF
jgi:F-box domain